MIPCKPLARPGTRVCRTNGCHLNWLALYGRWEGCRCAQALSPGVPRGRCAGREEPRPGRHGRAGGRRLRRPRDDVVEVDAPRGHRRRREARDDRPGERGTAGSTSADQVAGAGERGFCGGRRRICRRRTCREKDLPARERAGRRRGARHGCVPGAEARQTALLPLARRPGDRRRVRGGVSRERVVRRPS